ncbi:2-(1,2-epoxy-1,2-dihydrophenyl)acetyl-CoA isomerase PaaG [Aliikangiella coralliicola]|uniref:2-(1,2-epoxy-1,2-dihydrophenyl)acetyl-CoA isomerase n=1 Tax=Aliikangiella coralliicola TaxID=2592383 RepID=A0A545U522_9GAMM|nr:2-(1,2-epoxy-1,2-dihydrophenyl)acetyl-CoA isomerase PaaG [Aliikangiella coralliicola]TQV84568.1 2-(1,2-epoxy-1,2-dihydrophenyl)acetyl-CoA isomerase [Aliikangiella coralliicola]
MYQTIVVEKSDGVAKLTLNRPDRLNSFNVQMHEELQTALDEISTDKAVRCLLLTGAGRGFCAGQDLNDRAVSADQAPPDLGMSVEKFYNPLIRRITNLKMPVVCALNGVAAGAGASLVMACDIVVAARSSSFILSFAKVGLVPDSGSSWHFARAIGLPRAKAMAMLGNKVKAEQAEQWGLIYQVVDDDALTEETDELSKYLAKQPTEALANIKTLVHTAFDFSMNEQLERERQAMQHLGRSHDYSEGVAAFIEKREPDFKGR